MTSRTPTSRNPARSPRRGSRLPRRPMRGAGAAAPPPPSASDPIELDATGKFKRFDALPNMPAVLIELQKALRYRSSQHHRLRREKSHGF